MAKLSPKERMKLPRQRMPEQDPKARAANFLEVNLGLDAESANKEAIRCLQCAKAKCVDGCPVGMKITEVIALGGVAKKSDFVMQTVADVLNTPIKVVRSEQACALGAAMFAAVVGGVYACVTEAQAAMGSGFETAYAPNADNAAKYEALYERYSALGGFVEQETA